MITFGTVLTHCFREVQGFRIHFTFFYILHSSLQKKSLMNNTKSVNKDIIKETDTHLVTILIFSSSKNEHHINSKRPSFSTDFVLRTECISCKLF